MPYSRPSIPLNSRSHVMQWNPALNIYRVNRYQKQFTLEDKLQKFRYEESKLDFLEELLCRNLDHCAEYIISLLDFEDQLSCVLVCHLWQEFIESQVFKRRVEVLVHEDEGLQQLAVKEGWADFINTSADQVEDLSVYKKILAKVFLLKDVWKTREPKAKRLFCDSFVLSIKSDEETIFCGLNNGALQSWDLKQLSKTREEELHNKGIKCLDLNSNIILTGSYDTHFKVWRRDTWTCVKTFPLHTDSVWDLKLHGSVAVTAGLDGTVIVYDLVNEYDLTVRCYIQVNGDLVSAVDFGQDYIVTGYEESFIRVWDMTDGQQVHHLDGHNGGVTGLALQGNLLASSSYDGTVGLWDVELGRILRSFLEPDNFVRCIDFQGLRIVSGDFGGNVHLWDIELKDEKVSVKNHRKWECHKGHIVCIQLNACRIVSGSRDRHVVVNDFWAKTMDAMARRENKPPVKMSRFLNRPL